jgi:hypothetical protein
MSYGDFDAPSAAVFTSKGYRPVAAGEHAIPRPALESLGTALERLETSAERIQRFVDRFHGGGPIASNGGSTAAPRASGHGGTLQEILSISDRFDTLAATLDQIG